jgi:hypothetical protein
MPRVMPVVSLIAVGAMCRWMSVKVVFLGVVAGLGRKLGKAPAVAGDDDTLGRRSPPWRRLLLALLLRFLEAGRLLRLFGHRRALMLQGRSVGFGLFQLRALSTEVWAFSTSSSSLASV